MYKIEGTADVEKALADMNKEIDMHKEMLGKRVVKKPASPVNAFLFKLCMTGVIAFTFVQILLMAGK